MTNQPPHWVQPLRVIIMLLGLTLLGTAAEPLGPQPKIPQQPAGPPVVVIPEVPNVQLPRLAVLPNEVRDRLRDQADAVTRKALLAAAQQSNQSGSNVRSVPPPIPGPVIPESGVGVGSSSHNPPPATGQSAANNP